ncbi:Arc family DNA-binding protein [Rhizobium leguminosarum]|uniref:Arc family DNA-binding protein n=1 Tax=Rhizobium leguminosarum TaxID=384 RepID=UPI001C93B0CB|nr:Arc family DNA-binding protein [Rhizobium leguminosarum]MBY5579592.1 Arc family DNA-binding protein [Rhizobium leguminosarum]
MGREDPQLKLRLTEGMKEEIAQAAKRNGRSVNAEIVHRLERTLHWEEDGEKEADQLIATLEAKLKDAVEVNEYLEGLRKLLEERLEMAEEGNFKYIQVPEDRTLYVLLDANGMPVSWQEITLHLGEIGRAANFKIDKIDARIFDVASASNNEREEEFWSVFENYRNLRKGKKPKSKQQKERDA